MAVKYLWLADLLRKQILENQTEPFKLPTEQQLCLKYGLSRQTVRHALSILEEEKLIQRRQGSGAFSTGLSLEESLNTIALLVKNDSEYTYPALINDIRRALQGEGYSLSLYITNGDFSTEREILQELLLSPVRGIISETCKSTLPSPNVDLYEKLLYNKTTILLLGGANPNMESFPCILDDNYGGGYYIAGYLNSLKHKNIGAVFCSDESQGVYRYFGLHCGLRDLHIPFPDSHICWYQSSQLYALQIKQDTTFLSQFIKAKAGALSAIVCQNDEIAYWLIKELQYAGLDVPSDISVISFDNSYLCDLSSVSISSLSHKSHEFGTSCVSMLIRMMNGYSAQDQKLSWHLSAKNSCVPYRISH